MQQPPMASWNRRRFLTQVGALVAASALAAQTVTARGAGAAGQPATFARTTHKIAPAAPLLDGVSAACAPGGCQLA